MQPTEPRTRTPRHLTTAELQDFVRGHPWKYARTMPTHPHDYLLRTKARDVAEFERAARTIRETGFIEKYGARDYTVLDVEVDQVVYKLWTMPGDPLGGITLINRCVRRVALPETFRQMVELQATAVRNMQQMIAAEPSKPSDPPEWQGYETDRTSDF